MANGTGTAPATCSGALPHEAAPVASTPLFLSTLPPAPTVSANSSGSLSFTSSVHARLSPPV
eukprot:4061191-Pleurochrysis_carterae.AAC.1